MENIFIQLALILSLCCAFGLLILRLKLPLVVAYLLAGVTLSLINVFDVSHSAVLEILPEIGIAFVLFLIGMELDLREIRALGKPIIASSLGQVLICALGGLMIARLLGFDSIESLYIGFALAFSSTIVVIKMLLEKRDLASLYGKLSIGILLMEDLVAIAVLMAITIGSSALQTGLQNSWPILALFLKACGLFALTFILSKYVLEKVFDMVAKSVELLFLTAITWCFAFTSLAILGGFSVVIGAFLAGVALASSPYHLQIQGKIKPLRDFFVALFFVYLGSQAKITDVIAAWPAVVIFTLFAIIVKPLVYIFILGLFGFRKHTLFQTGLNLSQISEFSLVVLLVGVQYNVVSPLALSVMAAVAVLSIIFSSILIAYSKQIYKAVSPILPYFEHKTKRHVLEQHEDQAFADHIIIIGARRVGGPVVKYLSKANIPFVVMDFNPHIVEELRSKNINVIYGDVGDPDVVDYLQLEHAKLIICTATDITDNEILLAECKRRKSPATIVLRAIDHNHVQLLKDMGADYVILPEKVSGDFLVNQLRKHWPTLQFSGMT